MLRLRVEVPDSPEAEFVELLGAHMGGEVALLRECSPGFGSCEEAFVRHSVRLSDADHVTVVFT